ncbi:NITA [Symbiodinium natans]|uniref:NITA protein n=1 Tax=Symbiodinium natans TaxID=878477 RepID=A0A812TQT9_9DINO|nr:NITA [Symbiodinium natans]
MWDLKGKLEFYRCKATVIELSEPQEVLGEKAKGRGSMGWAATPSGPLKQKLQVTSGYDNMMVRGGGSRAGEMSIDLNYRPVCSNTREGESTSVRAFALHGEEGAEPEPPSTMAAGVRLLGGLQSMADRTLNLEAGSVYGAVILMPQIARTLGWPAELSSLVVTSVTYHLLLIFLHGALLTFIDQEEIIQDAFAGQMHLCNFGGGTCDGGECPGPGGTTVTPPRIYSFNTWATRLFVRDSMQAIWPEKAEDIAKLVDPGEYGIESSLCRFLCCFVFVMMIVPEIGLCWEMANIMWQIPSEDEPWVSFREDRQLKGPRHEWLDMVRVRIAGMSRLWKAACVLLVLLPKCFLCVYSAKAGVVFLMETSDIDTARA